MNKKNKNKFFPKVILLSFLIVFSFSLASSAFAQALVPCGLNGAADCTLCHLVVGFKNIYDYLLFVILLPASILVIVVAGVMYMVSSGSKGLIDKAKSAFTYALTAIILALTAWLIINATLYALGYSKAGSWSSFSCDTTQSSGPSVNNGSTAPQNGTTGPQNNGNTAQGDGTCGGIKVAQNADQCKDTSAQLDSVLKCINEKVAMTDSKNNFALDNFLGITTARAGGGVTVSSLGQNQNGGNWKDCTGSGWSSANCPHSQNSCHYGGANCQGQINAADLTGDMSTAKDAAIACGADTVIYGQTAYFGGQSKSASDHNDHVHISVNNAACGCDYLK